MSTLAFCHNAKIGTGDLAAPLNAQLTHSDAFNTRVYTILNTHARVTADSQLPHGETDRGGHWADMFYDNSFGSLLWTLRRENNIEATWQRAQRYAQAALTLWIPTSDARDITVTTGYHSRYAMFIHITATLPNGDSVRSEQEYRFDAA